jgi:hypothetical protein
LARKGYVHQFYDRTSFVERTKPAIYCLEPRAREVFRKLPTYDNDYDLSGVYRDKQRSPEFQLHCIQLAKVSLRLEQIARENNQRLKFFTKPSLRPYRHFPQPLPDAYFALETQEGPKRYFLEIIDSHLPRRIIRYRAQRYIKCYEETWTEGADGFAFPVVLFISQKASRTNTILKSMQRILDEGYSDMRAYITSLDQFLQRAPTGETWQRVESEY